MGPGDKRRLGFTYGLNTISSVDNKNANLSITVGGSFRPKGDFTVTAYVKNPHEGQKVTLHLPEGLTLTEGQQAAQMVDRVGDLSQVSWRVKAGEPDEYRLEVTSGLDKEAYRVKIRASGLFD